MSQLRNVGTIPTATFNSSVVQYFFFCKLEMPTPVGTKRYTQYPGGFTGDIDGASETWTELGFVVPNVTDSYDDVLNISAIEFPNLDNTFTDWSMTYGLKLRKLWIYIGFFDPSDGSFIDAFERWHGLTDEAELSSEARVTLRNFFVPWSRQIPPLLIGPKCISPFKDPVMCQYAGAGTSCNKSRATCSTYSNLTKFNGFDLLPPAGTIIKFGSE